MDDDQYIERVLDKCEALVEADIWAREPSIRPRPWLLSHPLK
jgi:hypothetical protein